LVAGLLGFMPLSLPSGLSHLLGLLLLAGLLLIPILVSLYLAHRPDWESLKPLGLSFLLVAGYGLVAIALRAIAAENDGLETGLRLGGLILLGVATGLAALRAAGVPRPLLFRTLGFDSPSLAWLILGAGLMGLLTLGWPLTGALGDSWATWGLLLHALALTLPEEILFRGAVWGILAHGRPGRATLGSALSLLIYLAFIPTRILPTSDWEALGLIFVLFPVALLTTQLRVSTGNIWTGVIIAFFCRAAPLLFTDSRDEIMEPTQWLAGGAMLVGAAILALFFWLGRRFLASRWSLPKVANLALAGILAVLIWAVWLVGWVLAGQPGFHDDGFIIVMEEQADLSAAYDMTDPLARRAYVYEKLVATAEDTQAPVRDRLEARGLAYRPYFLINMIRVEGHHRQAEDFADLPGVAYVLLNPNVRPYPTHDTIGSLPASEGGGLAWNIRRVDADDVWDLGYRGQGVVVGGQDTGYDWLHPALKHSYRGWDTGTGHASHDYNWHDAWDDRPVPFDDDEHGTHTMGTVLGDDGRGNQIGMAPEARWIGCRNMRRGIGNPASYTQCMEFFLAPYPVDGDPFHDGDVTRAPDVVNNSWGCPDFEGCQDDTLKPALEALRAAGIMMVVSAGNDGPACGTAGEPPARYDTAFSVGASDSGGVITSFSSRGPITDSGHDGALLRPDVVAPGADIRSSTPGADYRSAGGTSMAGPHVAGLVALLWSARPDLRGDIEATEDIIRRSARPVPVSAACSLPRQPDNHGLLAEIVALSASEVCACGDVTGIPNNVYGWGEINALRAVEMALEGRP
jgi:hypothetical protein